MEQSKFPLEDVMRTLKALKEEGLFKDVGLSEVGGETIRRASKVSDVVQYLWCMHGILSLLSYVLDPSNCDLRDRGQLVEL